MWPSGRLIPPCFSIGIWGSFMTTESWDLSDTVHLFWRAKERQGETRGGREYGGEEERKRWRGSKQNMRSEGNEGQEENRMYRSLCRPSQESLIISVKAAPAGFPFNIPYGCLMWEKHRGARFRNSRECSGIAFCFYCWNSRYCINNKTNKGNIRKKWRWREWESEWWRENERKRERKRLESEGER